MIRIVPILVLAILTIGFAGLAEGDQIFTATELFAVLTGDLDAGTQVRIIVLDLRLPRVLLGLLVGAALGVAGAITQGVMRNPLADPGLIGVGAGAALAALIVIVHYRTSSPTTLSVAALCGALVMAAAIYVLSWRGGTSSIRIILIGIGLSALAGAAASFISVFGEIAAVQRAQVWLAGSLYGARWIEVQVLALWLVLPIGVALLASRELDLLILGDALARALGQRVQFVIGLMILVAALISAAAVVAAGMIGFIGLVAPHAARRLVGVRHVRLIPVSGLLGAFLVSAADFVGRVVIQPAQLPAGLMATLIGAPFFGWLLWRKRRDPV